MLLSFISFFQFSSPFRSFSVLPCRSSSAAANATCSKLYASTPSLALRPTATDRLSLCSASNCLTAGGHLVNSGPLRNPRGSQTVGWIFISPAYKSAHTHAEKTRREILPSRSAYYQASKPRQRGPNNVLRCMMNISNKFPEEAFGCIA